MGLWGSPQEPVVPAGIDWVMVVIAVMLWGPQWAGRRVCCLCDNTAVVAAVNRGAAKDPTLSHLLRLLAFNIAVLDIHITAPPRGSKCISWCVIQEPAFFSLNPQASRIPAIIPPQLRENDDRTLRGTLRQQNTTWDFTELDSAVEHFLDSCTAPSTCSVYCPAAAQRRYAGFCLAYGISNPYPLQEDILCKYEAYLEKASNTEQ